MKLDTWKNPEAIVSCEWLSQNLNNKNRETKRLWKNYKKQPQGNLINQGRN